MAITPKFVVDRLDAVSRLEAVRVAVNKGKGQFAATLGMYPPNYSRLLKGEFFLTADQLYTIWRLYGADPAFIMEGREDGVNAGLLTKLHEQAPTR